MRFEVGIFVALLCFSLTNGFLVEKMIQHKERYNGYITFNPSLCKEIPVEECKIYYIDRDDHKKWVDINGTHETFKTKAICKEEMKINGRLKINIFPCDKFTHYQYIKV